MGKKEGVNLDERVRLLLNYGLEGRFDLVALKEVKFSNNAITEAHFRVIYNLGPQRLGMALLIRRGILFNRELIESDGRLISVDVGSFTFINIYAPSGNSKETERNDFFRRTVLAYAGSSSLPLILLGVFNFVDQSDDRNISTSYQKPTQPYRRISKALIELTAGLELVDIWLRPNASDRGHTFHYPNGSSRIDRVYLSRGIASSFSEISSKTLSISDHFPLEFSYLRSFTSTT